MNVEDVQNFVSEIVNFCKDNTIYGELVPIDPIYELDIQPEDIEYIKKFIKNNPIVTFPSNIRYKKSVNFSGHTFLNASYNKPDEVKQKDQIFMPTWILTTIILSRLVRDLSARSVFDFGSGDGRIQYFASSIGLRTYGIEYSDILVNVQK